MFRHGCRVAILLGVLALGSACTTHQVAGPAPGTPEPTPPVGGVSRQSAIKAALGFWSPRFAAVAKVDSAFAQDSWIPSHPVTQSPSSPRWVWVVTLSGVPPAPCYGPGGACADWSPGPGDSTARVTVDYYSGKLLGVTQPATPSP
jgi:hypothetical protein